MIPVKTGTGTEILGGAAVGQRAAGKEEGGLPRRVERIGTEAGRHEGTVDGEIYENEVMKVVIGSGNGRETEIRSGKLGTKNGRGKGKETEKLEGTGVARNARYGTAGVAAMTGNVAVTGREMVKIESDTRIGHGRPGMEAAAVICVIAGWMERGMPETGEGMGTGAAAD
jgi:hypothetical protein